jgi:hypothetical protein
MTGTQTSLTFNADVAKFRECIAFYANAVLSPSFFFSQLREKTEAHMQARGYAIFPSWYGNVAAAQLKKLGFHRSNNCRRSPIHSRACGTDFEWVKGVKV